MLTLFSVSVPVSGDDQNNGHGTDFGSVFTRVYWVPESGFACPVLESVKCGISIQF